MSKGHIDYNIRKVYNMLLALQMEPKEAKARLAHSLNLHTEQGKADLNYMLVDAYGRDNLHGMELQFENRKCKAIQFYQAMHTAMHDGLSVRQTMKAVDIGQYKYYAELDFVEDGSKEYHQLHSHELNLSTIEGVLKIAKTYPIL